MHDTIDAEFTSPMNGAMPSDVDPATGEVLEARPLQAIARQDTRAQLAVGAAQAIAMAQKEKSLMEARMSIARERPRDWMMVRQKLLAECQRPGFADAAIYSKPVGGQEIEGMSIRFAEACIRTAGNIRTTTEVVEDGGKTITYRVTVLDLEGGSSFDEEFTLSKTVERSSVGEGRVLMGERTNSRGKKTYLLMATEDELANKKGAAASKLIRNCVLRLMPGDIVDECRAVCERTIANRDAKNPALARNSLLDAFAALGILPKQVADYLGKESAELITPVEVTKMRPIYAALKDGETTWQAVMEAKGKTAGAPKTQAAPPPPAAAPAAVAQPTQPSPPASPAPQQPAGQGSMFEGVQVTQVPSEVDPIEREVASIREGLKAAKAKKDFQPLLERIRTLPADDRKALEGEYREAVKGVQ